MLFSSTVGEGIVADLHLGFRLEIRLHSEVITSLAYRETIFYELQMESHHFNWFGGPTDCEQ